MTKKLTATQKAIRLLKKQGYKVIDPQPDVRIGDVYEIEGIPVLITLYDNGDHYDKTGSTEVFRWGGYPLQDMDMLFEDRCLESMWMEESSRLNGEYKLLGHVDLSNWIK